MQVSLIAQDLGDFGRDLKDEAGEAGAPMLEQLLARLVRAPGHPETFTRPIPTFTCKA